MRVAGREICVLADIGCALTLTSLYNGDCSTKSGNPARAILRKYSVPEATSGDGVAASITTHSETVSSEIALIAFLEKYILKIITGARISSMSYIINVTGKKGSMIFYMRECVHVHAK